MGGWERVANRQTGAHCGHELVHVDVMTTGFLHRLFHFGQGERTADNGVGALGINQWTHADLLVEIRASRRRVRSLCRVPGPR
jgi:hypothetical protein